MKKSSTNGRRQFVKWMLSIGAGIGLVSVNRAAAVVKPEKVKMLAPDGTLVEIDKSVLEKHPSTRATNQEVRDWMETGKKS